jgi:hypothetical protein
MWKGKDSFLVGLPIDSLNPKLIKLKKGNAQSLSVHILNAVK